MSAKMPQAADQGFLKCRLRGCCGTAARKSPAEDLSGTAVDHGSQCTAPVPSAPDMADICCPAISRVLLVVEQAPIFFWRVYLQVRIPECLSGSGANAILHVPVGFLDPTLTCASLSSV